MEEKKPETKIKIETKPKKNKVRILLVIAFIALFLIVSFISLKSSYLEFKELGENYEEIFWANMKYKYLTMGICFIVLYIVMYFTNRGIKKSLKPFFETDKKETPKLPNKSIALIFSTIGSLFIGSALMEKIVLFIGNTSFGIQNADPIFNMDIGYYMFQKPLIETGLMYLAGLIIFLTIYSIIYHIIVFNFCFESVDGKMLKKSLVFKKIIRNVRLLAINIALITILNTQNILFDRLITIDGNMEITGANYTNSTIKLWGYIIFAVVIVIAIFRATINLKKGDRKKLIKDVLAIPVYLVGLFIVLVGFDAIFVSSNKLEKEGQYLQYNINNTKQAYNINIEEKNISNSGTITENQVNKNKNIIDNIAIVSKDAVLKTLNDNQTEKGFYTYKMVNPAKYTIDGFEKVVYMSPREIANKEKTYNNKTYEYTHSNGIVVTSATNINENGGIEYIQKDIEGKDKKINIYEPRMYFGLEGNDMIATNVEGKSEYDYTDENGNEVTTSYTGQAGLNLGFIDKLILGVSKGNLNIAFSGDVKENSKIIINRNILNRAKKALPYLVYDENPYTVVDKNGQIIWVLDAYTTSSNYPCSQYTSIEYNNKKERINYIRNSVKVLINAYSGEMSFYITDRSDPIAMAYEKVYPTLFKDKNEEISNDISNHFIYPKYLYDIQAKMLEVYHNVKPDVLYREDDIWKIAKFNTSNITNATGTTMESFYTMVKNNNKEDLGLIQIYNPKDKQSLNSYLVGVAEGKDNKLTVYKFSQDSNVAGPMQLAKQIEDDEAISKELETISFSGTKITKQMIIVPIENTLLYVEPVYQTMINEKSNLPVLKKVIVASGNKVAIGDNLSTALQRLLSQYAVDIEIENTDDIDGLIESIIKANNNLTKSNETGNWELMGKDIEKLQDLIKSLEKLKTEEDNKKIQDTVVTSVENNTTTTDTVVNTNTKNFE